MATQEFEPTFTSDVETGRTKYDSTGKTILKRVEILIKNLMIVVGLEKWKIM